MKTPKKKPTKLHMVSVRVDARIWAALQEQARALDRTVAYVARDLLWRGLQS